VSSHFGVKNATAASIAVNPKTIKKIRTRRGNAGFKNIIISGNVIKTAIEVEDIMVTVTTIGMDLINSPMIPEARSNGTNAQMVVIVVDQRGTIKSLHTKTPVSAGVNFRVA
jgi:hypothetical protein